MTKSHTPKAPKPTQKPKVFTSDKSWGGKNILTGEAVAPQHGEPSMPPGWKTSESYVDAEGWVNCFCDGKLIARYMTEEAKSKKRKEEKNNE